MSTLPIHTAALNKQYNLVRVLVDESPASADEPDADGRTPLHWAASSGAVDIVAYLLDRNVQVNRRDISGWTPLHIAASAGREDIVRELLGAGADVKMTNDKGMTALHYAASKSRVEIGKLLIARGADINARDKANQLPLHRAATTGSSGFISLLLHPPEGSPKTRLNTADRMGNTPLHLAMDSGHGQAAVLLIEAGADRERTNQDELTPEQMEGVGGTEQKKVREYVVDHCGTPPT